MSKTYRGQYMTRVCLCCANSGKPCRVEEDEQCPVVVKVSVGVANPDFPEAKRRAAFDMLPDWVQAILAMPNPQVIICAHCAGALFGANPTLRDHAMRHVPEQARRELFGPKPEEPEPVEEAEVVSPE